MNKQISNGEAGRLLTCSALLALAEKENIRIKIRNGKELFGDEADNLIMVGGAIATPELYENFEESLAHLQPDGRIMRHRQQIAHWTDIDVIRANVKIRHDADSAAPQPKGHSNE